MTTPKFLSDFFFVEIKRPVLPCRYWFFKIRIHTARYGYIVITKKGRFIEKFYSPVDDARFSTYYKGTNRDKRLRACYRYELLGHNYLMDAGLKGHPDVSNKMFAIAVENTLFCNREVVLEQFRKKNSYYNGTIS